ncbi:MAG: sigma-70 factor domain-containing protein, partial [Verrucomicrobiota bacterium]
MIPPDTTSATTEKPAASPGSDRKKADAEEVGINSPEIQARIRDLIRIAKEQEYLTYDDLNENLPADITPDLIEEVMERLRSMEFEIIEASEVDRIKSGTASGERGETASGEENEPEPERSRSNEKEDALDDPVRMYLKQMGQVPLLTREQEVQISKRIEKADTTIQKILHRFGFIPDAYIELAENLQAGEERIDRLVLDKHIEDRERYLKALPKICEQIQSLRDQIVGLHESGPDLDEEQTAEIKKAHSSLNRLYNRLHFKQKVCEEFVTIADGYHQELVTSSKEEDSEKKGDPNLFRRETWCEPDDFSQAYRDLKTALDSSRQAKQEMVEANLRLV